MTTPTPAWAASRESSVAQRRLSVLHVFGSMDFGGAEVRTLELMRILRGTEVRFHFCTLSGRVGGLGPEIRDLGGTVHPCRLGLRFPHRFRKLLDRLHVQVVHSHVQLFSGYVLRLAESSGVGRRIAHLRSASDGHGDTRRRKLQRRVMRQLVDRHATHLLAVSESVMESAWSPHWRRDPRAQVLYEGVDLSRFERAAEAQAVRTDLAVAPGGTLCVQVGRLDAEKNQQRTLAIFAALSRKRPDVALAFVGRDVDGSSQRLARAAALAGLSGKVIFTGERHDVPGILKAADLMIHPTLREGLPGVVVESCAAGTPVLASDIRPNAEVARFLDLAHVMPLDSSDSAWADKAIGLLACAPTPESRAAALTAFRRSPFKRDDSAQQLLAIWRGDA